MEEAVDLVLERKAQGMRLKDAVRDVAADTGLSKRTVRRRTGAVTLNKNKSTPGPRMRLGVLFV